MEQLALDLPMSMHDAWMDQVATDLQFTKSVCECERCGIEVPDSPIYYTDEDEEWCGLCSACVLELRGTDKLILASPLAHRIVGILRHSERFLNIAEIAHMARLSRRTVSRWLHDLEKAGVTAMEKAGNATLWRCTDLNYENTIYHRIVYLR